MDKNVYIRKKNINVYPAKYSGWMDYFHVFFSVRKHTFNIFISHSRCKNDSPKIGPRDSYFSVPLRSPEFTIL